MASVSWPSVSAVPDGTTIGTNSQGQLTVLQAPKLVTPAGFMIQDDSVPNLGFYDSSTDEGMFMTSGGDLVVAAIPGATVEQAFVILRKGVNLPANHVSIGADSGDAGVTMYSTTANNGIWSWSPSSGYFQLSNSLAFNAPSGPQSDVEDVVNITGLFQTATLSSSYSTTSTSLVSSGLGVNTGNISFPSGSGPVVIEGVAYINNNTLGDGVSLALYRSTAGIPAAGSAPPSTDTRLVVLPTYTQEGLTGNNRAQTFMYVDSPTNGNYYYYLALSAVTGGTATLTAPGTVMIVRGW